MATSVKDNQRRVYNRCLLGDIEAGLGLEGFAKIKTLKDLVIYNFVKKLKPELGHKVLDVGCNAGELLNKIAVTYGVEGFGLDISDKTIAVAKANNPLGNKYMVSDAEKIGFRADFFDAVVCTDVLEHLSEPEKCLAEIARVLKPGGRFFIYCISARNKGTVRWLMQKFSHRHAWGDLGDHRQELLIDPGIFHRQGLLKITKTFYFHSFFTHLVDEFLIRPLLSLLQRAKSILGKRTGEKAGVKAKNVIRPARRGRSFVQWTYLAVLSFVFMIFSTLDLSWRMARVSDAILVIGEKSR